MCVHFIPPIAVSKISQPIHPSTYPPNYQPIRHRIKHIQDFKKADNKTHFETSKYVPRQQPRQQ